METRATDPPEEFTELVRGALLNLYDPTALQTHPLLAVAGGAEASSSRLQAGLLRQALLEAVHALHPGSGVAVTSRAWRTFRILELRYLEGYEAATVSTQVCLSKSQYHREHNRALHAVATLLWERWQLAGRWASLADAGLVRTTAEHTQTWLEVERLGQRHEQTDRIDLRELAQGVSQVLQPLCAERGIGLELVLPADSLAITGERVMLRQALLTILVHAITIAEHGPIQAAFSEKGRWVDIEIRGYGTDRLHPDHLGVSESRPFVEALKGRLSYLPALSRSERWRIQLSLPAGEHPTLLVVDNDADFVRLIERYLTSHDWDVVGRADTDQAYAFLRKQPPQAIMLDIVLPGHDGWELLLELKARPATRDIPVLICSVLDEPTMARSLGAAAYLHKPIDQRQLVAVLAPFR